MRDILGIPEEAARPAVRQKRLRCCIVLPAFNEARHLAAVIDSIPAWIDSIIVVDDASTDDTLAVAEAHTDARVTVLHLESNEGVGSAMVHGYRAALAGRHDIVVKMDADGQMDPEELPTLVHPLQLDIAEYTKGNRFRQTGKPRDMPWMRWFGSVMLSFLTKIASGYWHVFDPQCGFTAITAPTLTRLNLDGVAHGFFFENDMLIRLNVIDARVVDVSTATLYGNEHSTLRVGQVTWTFPLRLLRGFLWRFVKRHVVNDFGLIAVLTLLGGLLLVFGVAFGAYHWVESALTTRAATAGTVMIAVVPIILGAQLLLQALMLEVQTSAGASETREYARLSGQRRAPSERTQ